MLADRRLALLLLLAIGALYRFSREAAAHDVLIGLGQLLAVAGATAVLCLAFFA